MLSAVANFKFSRPSSDSYRSLFPVAEAARKKAFADMEITAGSLHDELIRVEVPSDVQIEDLITDDLLNRAALLSALVFTAGIMAGVLYYFISMSDRLLGDLFPVSFMAVIIGCVTSIFLFSAAREVFTTLWPKGYTKFYQDCLPSTASRLLGLGRKCVYLVKNGEVSPYFYDSLGYARMKHGDPDSPRKPAAGRAVLALYNREGSRVADFNYLDIDVAQSLAVDIVRSIADPVPAND